MAGTFRHLSRPIEWGLGVGLRYPPADTARRQKRAGVQFPATSRATLDLFLRKPHREEAAPE